jgi:hypothetical protein
MGRGPARFRPRFPQPRSPGLGDGGYARKLRFRWRGFRRHKADCKVRDSRPPLREFRLIAFHGTLNVNANSAASLTWRVPLRGNDYSGFGDSEPGYGEPVSRDHAAVQHLKDVNGNLLTGRTVGWSSSDAAVAT